MTRLSSKYTQLSVEICVVSGLIFSAAMLALAFGSRTLHGQTVQPSKSSEVATRERPRSNGESVMVGFRQRAYIQTDQQTIAEVVEDLGNIFVMTYTADPRRLTSPDLLEYWAGSMPSYLKVLRLIEEGRKDSSQITTLLKQAISDSLSTYNRAREAKAAYDRQWAAGKVPAPTVAADDPYYLQHKRYQDPTYELKRLHQVVYCSFYVLANIGQLRDPGLLAEWIRKEKLPGYNCRAMDIWLIDCYFNVVEMDETAHTEKHTALFLARRVSGSYKEMARWNEPWSLEPPFRAVKDLDNSKIETIRVLDIPNRLSIREQIAEAITV